MSEADGDAGAAASDGEQPSLDGAQDTADGPALVLIIEDEQPIADALAFIIADVGHLPILAKHGRQGLEIVRDRHPNLIITDLMMPVMDGAEFIARLHAGAQDGLGPVPPIVVMTAGGLRRAQEVGADEVLPKPFDVETVEDLLRRYIRSGWRRLSTNTPPSQ